MVWFVGIWTTILVDTRSAIRPGSSGANLRSSCVHVSPEIRLQLGLVPKEMHRRCMNKSYIRVQPSRAAVV